MDLTPELPNGVRVQANTIGQAVDHPALLEAYPDLANIRLSNGGARPNSGFYDQSANRIGLGDTMHNFGRSVLLHELQHAVQQGPEGFARGGSSKSIPREMIAQERQRINSIPEKESTVSPAGDLPDSALASNLYRRLAGEVEARAVQNRMDLTPERRRARYPWLDYDVPIEQQIVK